MVTYISEQPNEVKSRSTFSHLGLNSMVSNRGQSKGFFATFVELKSRLYTSFNTPDRTTASMQIAIATLYTIRYQKAHSKRAQQTVVKSLLAVQLFNLI